MLQDEVEKIELPAVATLQQLGWSYAPGAGLSPLLLIKGTPTTEEHSYCRDVTLFKGLELPCGA
ncbi:hypothetical protein [Vreelandella nanhaiensis]|uniref:Uncharacterized protein n=1 Tax=Vreelandella nanhaiensis TaxID=1258546 RepID=A0A3S0W7S1_9GAMM|nr:hypothetical protein [Halomonas nanhaiensis]RUR31164.1 hypothetical protein ELY38_10910 [Halomonas nanhaiensis]